MIIIPKKIIKEIKWTLFLFQLGFGIYIAKWVIPVHTINVTHIHTNVPTIRMIQSISEKVKITLVIQNRTDKLIYTESEINKL